MQVGCDRKARVARKSDDVAATDLLPAAYIDRQQVTVRSFVTVAVVDDDGTARCGARGDLLHAAVRRGEDARTFGHRIIDALMGLQGAVEGMDAHAVGGGKQRELLVDNGLYGRNPVAAVADRIQQTLQFEVRFVELGQRRFGLSDLLFEFQDDLTVGFVQQAFVRCEPLGFIFGVEIVRIGFEKDVEDVAVAFGNIFHHRAQRVVAGFEPGVFAPQLIGGVLELVFDGRVEEEREPDVVEDGCAEPHQYVKRDADRLLFGRARCGVFDRSAGSCHVIRRRYRG